MRNVSSSPEIHSKNPLIVVFHPTTEVVGFPDLHLVKLVFNIDVPFWLYSDTGII